MSEVMPFFLGEEMRAVRDHLDELDVLFGSGYRKNKDQILERIGILAETKLLLPYFLEQASKSTKLVNMIGAQCYLLHSGQHYYARLNFWLPKFQSSEEIRRRVEQYFSIGVLHNHSFDFFTVGLLGSGYISEFFEPNDPNIDDLQVGDKIDLIPKYSFILETGRTEFVTKSFDFHIQYEPEDFSISLNFIPKMFDKIGSRENAQFIVDPETFRIERKFLSDPEVASRDQGILA